jgi:threonine-phosphate decarboxylase
MTRYSHGGDIKSFAKLIECDISQVIDLSSNINFIKPTTDIDLNSIDISSYPTYERLYSDIATHYECSSSDISLYNGGSSAIFHLLDYLPNKRVYIYSPAYLEYKRALEIKSKEYILIDRLTDIDHEIESDSIVIFVNPSTPDGKLYDMDRLLDKWIAKDATIIIDESFIEFTTQKSAIEHIHRYDKLYILKSMTKLYSCAGVRVGIIISNSDNIKALESIKPLWQISEYDSAYISAVLQDSEFRDTTIATTQTNKRLLIDILKEYDFIDTIYPSSANFVLLRLRETTATTLQSHLAKYKIMIRDCSNFDYLDDRYVRIAIKSKESIYRLKEALDVF